MGKTIGGTIIWLASLWLLACGGSAPPVTTEKPAKADGEEVSETDPDSVSYEIEIEVDESKLKDAEKKELLQKINSKEAVSFEKISKLLARDHILEFNSRVAKVARNAMMIRGPKGLSETAFLNFLDRITQGLKFEDPHGLKVAYEERLEEDLEQRGVAKTLKYDRAFVTVADISQRGRMQCYSGTCLNQLVTRKLLVGQKFRQKHFVILFEPGHLLPGYMKETDEGWDLYGIETTAAGRAELQYGSTKELAGPIRVVDAEYWALGELYKHALADPQKTMDKMVRWTAEKYEIDLDKFSYEEERAGRPARAKGHGSSETDVREKERGIASSIFSFGQSEVQPGERERARLDKRKKEPGEVISQMNAGGNIGVGLESEKEAEEEEEDKSIQEEMMPDDDGFSEPEFSDCIDTFCAEPSSL